MGLLAWDLAVAAGEAAVAAGGKQLVIEKKVGKSKTSKSLEWQMIQGVSLILLSFSVTSFFLRAQQSKQAESAPSTPVQKTFGTAKEAAEALIKAADSFDLPSLQGILAPAF